jgi:hypothetical protein
MSLPGFTAEASLGAPVYRYRSPSHGAANAGVAAQQFEDESMGMDESMDESSEGEEGAEEEAMEE